jgi:hypothetical protein
MHPVHPVAEFAKIQPLMRLNTRDASKWQHQTCGRNQFYRIPGALTPPISARDSCCSKSA